MRRTRENTQGLVRNELGGRSRVCFESLATQADALRTLCLICKVRARSPGIKTTTSAQRLCVATRRMQTFFISTGSHPVALPQYLDAHDLASLLGVTPATILRHYRLSPWTLPPTAYLGPNFPLRWRRGLVLQWLSERNASKRNCHQGAIVHSHK